MKRKRKKYREDTTKERRVKADVNELKKKLKGFDKVKVPDKLASETYDTNSTSRENHFYNYKTDFIYRLLFETRQMMVIAACIHMKEHVADPELSEEVNDIQYSIFSSLEEKIFENIKFKPNDIHSDKYVPVELSKMIAKNLTEHYMFSKSCYHFVFNILNLINILDSVKLLVKRMVPKTKWITLIKLLKDIKPVMYEMSSDEIIFNKIHETVEDFKIKYMTNYGMLITEEEGKTYF